MRFKAEIMDENMLNRALVRISHEILEKNNGSKNLLIVGIKTRGVPIAKRIAEKIRQIDGKEVPVGIIDITMHRDDRKSDEPILNGTQIPASVEGRDVIIVDDVLYTGRTVRAAIETVLELGRPKTIQFAALIDRGHRELPIRADYIGKNIPTARSEVVSVSVMETDGKNNVELYDLNN